MSHRRIIDEHDVEAVLVSSRPRPREPFRTELRVELWNKLYPETEPMLEPDHGEEPRHDVTTGLSLAQAKLAIWICGTVGTGLLAAGAVAA